MTEIKVQPHNLDAEQELLGAILINNDVIPRVATFLHAEHFLYEAHRRIYDAAKTLAGRGEIANPVTLKAYFERDEVIAKAGGTAYLARLAAAATTVINAEDYARVVHDLAMRREMIGIGESLVNRAYDPQIDTPAAEMAAAAIGDLTRVTAGGGTSTSTSATIAAEIEEDLRRPLPCYSSGIPDWDESLGGGFYEGKCYGLAARKKVGKTTLLGSVSYNLNMAGVPHLFLPAEASPKEIEHRNCARFGRFNSIAFLKRDWPMLPMKVRQYRESVPKNVIYEAAAGLTFDALRSVVSSAIVRHKIKGVILDYWQLVGGKSARDTEEYHLRAVAQWLADMSRKHGLFCIVAAQVNQEGNTRGGEGLKLACDQYYTLHREKGEDGAWLEMEESRYTMYRNVGNDVTPGLRMNHHGPHYEDFSMPVREAAE